MRSHRSTSLLASALFAAVACGRHEPLGGVSPSNRLGVASEDEKVSSNPPGWLALAEGVKLRTFRVPHAAHRPEPERCRHPVVNQGCRDQAVTVAMARSREGFQRPLAGAWHPHDPNDFYFVAAVETAATRRQLWRLRFMDVTQPDRGAAFSVLLDGSESADSFEALTVDQLGRVYLRGSAEGRPGLASIWRYDAEADTLALLAREDGAYGDGSRGSPALADAAEVIAPGWIMLGVRAPREAGEMEQWLALYDPAAYYP